MRIALLSLLLALLLSACRSEPDHPDPPADDRSYFYPSAAGTWQTVDPASLDWNTSALPALDSLLASNGTRAFLILHRGRIAHERYWGKTVLGQDDFGAESNWYWASAGKTLTAFLCGLAQEQGHLNLQDALTEHLGAGWSSMADTLESAIRIIHQLTMTTGLDHSGDLDCTDPACLQFSVEPGTEWFYHNAPYTLTESVIRSATGIDYNSYTDQQLEGRIGMQGSWLRSGYNNVYWSRARDAARFGLLLLSKGQWAGSPILNDTAYFNAMVSGSQELNPSYGYLTWLNGKAAIIPPGLSTRFNVSLSPSAPSDLFAALGKNGQFIDVIPSLELVVVRMGEAPESTPVPIQFHDQMWQRISAVLP